MKKMLFAMTVAMAAALALRAETVTAAGRMDLGGVWHLREADNAVQFTVPIQVPGDVHSALFAAGKIPDPFFGQNELLTQDVGRKDWRIERSFTVPASLLRAKGVTLRLEDVDTFCTIEINGEEVGRTDNRFRRWDFDVKRFLKPGDNRIVGVFRSAENESNARAKTYDRPFQISNVPWAKAIELIRKPQCHGGWDWGLAQMVTGFCGPVTLIAVDDARIDYVYCDQDFTADRSRCTVTVHAEVTAPAAGSTTFAVRLGDRAREKSVSLAAGANRLALAIDVPNPKLWWPNGAGAQHLYPLEVKVGGETLTRKIGLRTIEVLNTPDRDANGREGARMAFRVNGEEIFCKGANWIPCDAFESRQTPARYRDLLASAQQANMNMVRLWGGGQFEHDAFYELCDELGLMVWHDMMFSCAIYPGDAAFLASVEKELAHQLRRLRDHASIALWCGDNECVGALNWFEPSRKDRPYYLKALQARTQVEADAVAKYDPARTFWPSSPCGGPGDYSDAWHNDNKGDMHNWTVWHENKGFDNYYKYKPRFCSEFGYQSFSSPEVAATFCGRDQLNPTAPDFEYHQKNAGGNRRMLETMARYFRFPEGAENMLWVSQIQQAIAIKTAVEGWRRLRPRCMGTLFWQLNDNWPVASWSAIEYGGKWKHLQYHAKRFFQNVAVVTVPAEGDAGNIEVWALNDEGVAVDTRVAVRTMDFQGACLGTLELPAALPPRSATRLAVYALDRFGTEKERVGRFLSLTLDAVVEGKPVAFANEWLFNAYKACPLADADVRWSARNDNGVWTVSLTTDRPAFFTWVNATGIPGEFSDNSFTLYPDRPVTLTFTPKKPDARFADFKAALSVFHLRRTYR